MRIFILLGCVALLTACGNRVSTRSPQMAFASGPISTACMRADRKSASRSLCGCVQAVANRELSNRDQSRAAKFFAEPQKAQDTRQADGAGSEAFWKRYKAFAGRAASSCRGA